MADKETKEVVNPRQNNKTNRQRREEEEKQIKMLRTGGIIAGGLVVVALIIAIILGISNNTSRKTVATVGDEKITVEEYQEAVRLQRTNINNNYAYLQQIYAMFGMDVDESTRESYAYQMSETNKLLLGQSVLSNMVDQRIMAYGAEKEGISVSDDEVETYYQSMFGYYPNGTPTSAPTSEPFEATPTVTDEQLAILRYTETPLPEEETVDSNDLTEEVEVSIEDAVDEAEAIVDETVSEAIEAVEEGAESIEEAVAEVEETIDEAAETVEETVETVEEALAVAEETADLTEEVITNTEDAAEEADPTPYPTSTVMSEDVFKQYEAYYFANNYKFSKEYMKKELKYELLKEKVEEKIEAETPRTADMVWARHILVSTEEEALEALERINNGEEWADVAADVSLDSTASNGGDLGWFTEGTMVQEFNDAAFSQEVGTISDPVETAYGWHLIQVIAHEEHPYTSSEFDTAVENAYQEWLDGYASQLEVTLESIDNVTPNDPAFEG